MMVHHVGFEPTTYQLSTDYSTTELMMQFFLTDLGRESEIRTHGYMTGSKPVALGRLATSQLNLYYLTWRKADSTITMPLKAPSV